MAKRSFDYSKLVDACGLDHRHGDEREINNKTLHFLSQNFSATKAEFSEILKKASKEVKNMPLAKYREKEHFQAAWQLSNLPPLGEKWDYLSCADPEKTGILCGTSPQDMVLLNEEYFNPFEIFGRGSIWGENLRHLYFSILWWSEAVSAVWAGIIIKDLIRCFQKKSLLALSAGETAFLGDGLSGKIDENEPLGKALELPISGEEARDFAKLCHKAALGSVSCGVGTGDVFKEWLRNANIGDLEKHGLSFLQAESLLSAGSRRMPELEIELYWNQNTGSYQFVCLIENRDAHGFKHAESQIPVKILFDVFKNASSGAKEDLIRLCIRGGQDKAEGLLSKALITHCD